MADQEEIRVRLEKMIEILQQEDAVSVEELKKQLGIKVRTLEEMRQEARCLGYQIENVPKKQSKERAWMLKSNTDSKKDIVIYRTALPKDIRALIILALIQSEKMSGGVHNIDSLYKCVCEINEGGKNYEYQSKDKIFHDTIDDMLQRKLLKTVSKNNSVYYDLGMECLHYLVALSDNSYEYSDKINEMLETLQNYSSDKNVLVQMVEKKLNMVISGDSDEHKNQRYILQGRWHDESNIYDLLKEKLGEYSYKKQAIRISYRNRSNEVKEYDIKVGVIMYSVEQDNLYILGEKCTFKSKNRQVFLVKNIENVQLLDIENDIYESKEYLDIAEKMFDISYSDPVSVKVRFVDYGNVIEKVQKLASSRMYATFEKADDGNWYYADEVCGISDFMSYLRSFGRSCEVLEPIELREQVKWSTNFTLERYAKEGLCDVE